MSLSAHKTEAMLAKEIEKERERTKKVIERMIKTPHGNEFIVAYRRVVIRMSSIGKFVLPVNCFFG